MSQLWRRDLTVAVALLRSTMLPTLTPLRAVALLTGAGALLLWSVLLWAGWVAAMAAGSLPADVWAGSVLAVTAAVWTFGPLAGGGSGHVERQAVLAVLPVPVRSVVLTGWVSSWWDVPYLLLGPVALSLSAAAWGLAGLVVGAAVLAVASAAGQVCGWLEVALACGRPVLRWGSLTAVGVVAVASGPAVAAQAPAVLAAGAAAADGSVLGLLAVLAGGALLGGLLLTLAGAVAARVWRQEMRAGRVRSLTALLGSARLSPEVSVLAAVVVNVLRARACRAALVGAALFPVLAFVAEGPVDSPGRLATVVALAAVATFCVNAFGYASGGLSVLLSWPVPLRALLVAVWLAGAVGVWLAQAVALAVAALLGSSVGAAGAAVLSGACLAALVSAIGLYWAVWWPRAADFDALRTKISGPVSVIGCTAVAAGAAAATAGLGAVGSAWLQVLVPAAGPAGWPWSAAVCISAVRLTVTAGLVWLLVRRVGRRRLERVSATVLLS